MMAPSTYGDHIRACRDYGLVAFALELVPPNVERGADYAVEEARKVLALSADAGIEGRIRHVMIPGMIEEDDDRPIEMKPKLDVLDYWSITDRSVSRSIVNWLRSLHAVFCGWRACLAPRSLLTRQRLPRVDDDNALKGRLCHGLRILLTAWPMWMSPLA